MARRNRLRGVLLALSLLTLQVAYIAPARANAELRAAHCCATHCQHARSNRGAARCCGIESADAEVATLKPTQVLQTPQADVLAFGAGTADRVSAQRQILTVANAAPSRTAPVFLLTRTLRL